MSDAGSAPQPAYGEGDGSFRAAGGEAGIRRLVEEFYAVMDRLPEARGIRDMHPDDLHVSIDKLARFLCGWLGGPRRYAEKYGEIRLPRAHEHLDVSARERDAWMRCMREALIPQPYAPAFKQYLLEQLAVPAERIRSVSVQRQADPLASKLRPG
jgi:hemoglobin